MVSKTIDNLTLMASVNDKIVLSLKRIETKDVNYIKAVGMVQLEKSFIISAFGAFFFTLKMLIMSINSFNELTIVSNNTERY